MLTIEAKAVVRLIGGPADGFVFIVPLTKIPPFVAVGHPVAAYERERGDGEVICYRFDGRRKLPVDCNLNGAPSSPGNGRGGCDDC